MRHLQLTIPQIGLIAGTKAASAAGLALLFGDRLPPTQRKTLGMALLAIGLVTALPLIADVFGRSRAPTDEG